MKDRIIVDSCCDLTKEAREELGIVSVPLTMIVDDKEYRDDEFLDIASFVDTVSSFNGKTSSASPAPYLYEQAFEGNENAYVITLSSKLSGSYSNAVIGNDASVENGNSPAYIFDSKSAAAGETLLALKLHELIVSDIPKEQIVKTMHRFIDDMKTYFVLENYSNLQKNGRLSKVTGSLIHMLNIKLIMGADGNGEIALYEKCRGAQNMLQKMLYLIDNSGKETKNENLVISHCNNISLAEKLKELVQERFHFKNIYIVPTGGLSSLYVDNKGVVMAF